MGCAWMEGDVCDDEHLIDRLVERVGLRKE
jgi:hypothetical protein